MAAPLNKTSADVTTPEGKHESVAVAVRTGQTTARISKGMTIIAVKEGVVAVERDRASRRGRWTVRFDDGTEWLVVTSKAGCKPCGR